MPLLHKPFSVMSRSFVVIYISSHVDMKVSRLKAADIKFTQSIKWTWSAMLIHGIKWTRHTKIENHDITQYMKAKILKDKLFQPQTHELCIDDIEHSK